MKPKRQELGEVGMAQLRALVFHKRGPGSAWCLVPTGSPVFLLPPKPTFSNKDKGRAWKPAEADVDCSLYIVICLLHVAFHDVYIPVSSVTFVIHLRTNATVGR